MSLYNWEWTWDSNGWYSSWLTRESSPAIQAALAAGFEEVAILEGRVCDIYGIMQDLVILELPLEKDDPPHLDF